MIPPDIIPPEWTRAADAAERETEARYARDRKLAPLAAELAEAMRRGEARARLESALRMGERP